MLAKPSQNIDFVQFLKMKLTSFFKKKVMQLHLVWI